MMDIDANWKEITTLLTTPNNEDTAEYLNCLIEDGLNWLRRGGGPPRCLSVTREVCDMIYCSLNDRYCS